MIMVTIEVVVQAVNQYIGLFLLEVSVLILKGGKMNVKTQIDVSCTRAMIVESLFMFMFLEHISV